MIMRKKMGVLALAFSSLLACFLGAQKARAMEALEQSCIPASSVICNISAAQAWQTTCGYVLSTSFQDVKTFSYGCLNTQGTIPNDPKEQANALAQVRSEALRLKNAGVCAIIVDQNE